VTRRTAAPVSHPRRLALVLWNGRVGGAEKFTVALASMLRAKGADARVLFVGDPYPLGERLRVDGVPYETLSLPRGRHVLLHPRRFARATTQAGGDGAILVAGSFLASALRFGGYRGQIAAVEHGSGLRLSSLPLPERLLRTAASLAGSRAVDVQVAVSDFVASRLNGAPPVVTIPNAVDLDVYRPPTFAARSFASGFVIGCMGRLVPSKGAADVLIGAELVLRRGARLRIAGEGPEREALAMLARRLGLSDEVEFVGLVDAAPFWRGCSVAVAASVEFESFGLAAVEAMACGAPVVATRSGGLTEIVLDGVTGFLVAPGDTDAIARALRVYFDDRQLLESHSAAARARCEQKFDLQRCAESYLALFEEQTPRGSR
jgi:glycosyltransferase involved in cell wall biosynthesis